MTDQIEHDIGSGNVFADLALPNADRHLLKAQLQRKLCEALAARKLLQTDAAILLGIRQPDVSRLLHGEVRSFSVERLLRFLVALGNDVEITVRARANQDETGEVLVA